MAIHGIKISLWYLLSMVFLSVPINVYLKIFPVLAESCQFMRWWSHCLETGAGMWATSATRRRSTPAMRSALKIFEKLENISAHSTLQISWCRPKDQCSQQGMILPLFIEADWSTLIGPVTLLPLIMAFLAIIHWKGPLCHKDTTKGKKCPLVGTFCAIGCVFMA